MWAEAFGLGELELSPQAFWSLTYREFMLKYHAFLRRENREIRRLAQLALWTDGAKFKKHERTPERLCGWPGPGPMKLYPVKRWLEQE